MRRRLLNVLAIASAACVMLSATPARADSLTDAQNKRDHLSGSIADAKRAIAQAQTQEAQAQAQLQLLQAQIALAESELADQNTRLDAILGELDRTQHRLDDTRVHLAHRQTVLAERTRGLYKAGGDSTIFESLFTAHTFSQLLDRFLVMRDVAHADQVLVEQIKADKTAIEELVAHQAQQRDEQQQVVDGIRTRQDGLRSQYVQLAALKAQLHATEVRLTASVAQAEAALHQVNGEIAALVAARGRAHSSGVFAWPGVQGPITQPFGCTDLAGEPSPPPGYSCPRSRPYFHTGIDIGGPYGAEIDATDGGIAYTYPGNSGYGNHVIIVHANGYASLYGHMSGFAVGSGQGVAKGQKIGYEGSTGFSTGAHLHFEIRLNDSAQDPCRYVGC